MHAQNDNSSNESEKMIPKVENRAAIIVFGNIKGGSGKSTTAMHVAIALLRLGYKVGTIDLDAKQGSFTRYFKHRFDFIKKTGNDIPSPFHMAIENSEAENMSERQAEEQAFLLLAFEELQKTCDFIIVDTPGADSFLSRLAHSYADTILTPMNDSFVDLDVLASVNPETYAIEKPSYYSKMVTGQRTQKKLRDNGYIRWLVMRNRLSHIDAKNKRDIGDILENLSKEFDFEVAPGFGERVIFRQLFLRGLTLLDMKETEDMALTMSELSARQEVRNLIKTLAPEKMKGPVRPPKKQEKQRVSI